jgi:hypothetical protein
VNSSRTWEQKANEQCQKQVIKRGKKGNGKGKEKKGKKRKINSAKSKERQGFPRKLPHGRGRLRVSLSNQNGILFYSTNSIQVAN